MYFNFPTGVNAPEAAARKPDSRNNRIELSDGNITSYADGVAVAKDLAEGLGRKSDSAGGNLYLNDALATDNGRNTWEVGADNKSQASQKGFFDDNFKTDLTRDDANGLRYLYGTNAVVFENSGQQISAEKFFNGDTVPYATTAPNGNEPKSAQLASDQQLSSGLRNSFRNGRASNFGVNGVGGLEYINPSSSTNTEAAQAFVSSLGVNLTNQPGKSVAYNDRLGLLFVRATKQDLDTIQQALNSNATSVAVSENGNRADGLQTRAFRFTTATNLAPTPTSANDRPIPKPTQSAPIPQPEFLTRENAFSTFSMNVSDVSYKLAQASLQKGQMPDPASIRSEEFINAFNYRDPEAAAGQPMAFASEVARDPFAHNRDFLRFSIKTAASGRLADRPLNLVLLLDTSGSMERADRVAIIHEALRVLASQLQPQDMVSVVTFARTPRLWADGVPGNQAGAALDKVGGITPDGGTNLEEAMRLAYETARRHYLANGVNRVVLLTDGAANLGNVNPVTLKQTVEVQRRQGISLDCFGIGWEDYNDNLLEELSGNGDGRYAFINSAEDADSDFAAKLAGALQVAAQDVKVQVEFNPRRVTAWRQIGYAKHQLTKEQFRDNSVIAAEIAAQEAGNALYTIESNPNGSGPIATVYVRYRIPGTQDVRERSWAVDYNGPAPALEQSSPAMRLAVVAAEFSEWLAQSPFAQEVTPDELLTDLTGVPQIYGCDQRPAQLEWMIRQAKSLGGQAMPVSQPSPFGRGGF
ncbi:MAG TPA: von Willebrand factor type A domain-containing protein [Verrucomicrobiae bacterium]|nr:von Willebrand factor type A domain-containing protein [Verrucomicrobiae bacterium]